MNPTAEIPLILFTLLTQLAVGIVLVGLCVSLACRAEAVRARLSGQSFFALLFVACGAFLSMIHLGTPLHSPFTILHVGSSWLSREIFMVLLTCAAMAGLVWLRWKRPGSRWERPLCALAALIGLALIYTMSRVYNSPWMPGWQGNATFFLFLASALILGSFWLACSLGVKLNAEPQAIGRALWNLFFFAMAGFVLLATFAPLSIPRLLSGINAASSLYSQNSVAFWQGVHAFLGGLGLLLFCCSLWRARQAKPAGGWLVTALLLGICGEIAGRSAFYMSYARLGM